MNGPLAVRARPRNAQAALREDALIRVDVNGGPAGRLQRGRNLVSECGLCALPRRRATRVLIPGDSSARGTTGPRTGASSLHSELSVHALTVGITKSAQSLRSRTPRSHSPVDRSLTVLVQPKP